MIGISFAMTSEAYADGTKTETRRYWKPAHAAKFHPERYFMGWTKDPRAGGVRIHPARVVSCRRERLGNISEESFRREGGTRYWPNREAYIQAMGGPDDIVSVLRFEHTPKAPDNPCTDHIGSHGEPDLIVPTPHRCSLSKAHAGPHICDSCGFKWEDRSNGSVQNATHDGRRIRRTVDGIVGRGLEGE